MIQRIVTSMIGLVVFFAVFFASETVFAAAVAILILMALYEMNKAMNTGKGLFLISLLTGGAFFLGFLTEQLPLIIAAAVMIFMISSVFLHGKYDFKTIYSSAFVTYFVVFSFCSLIGLRSDFGAEAVLLVFIFSWITDTGAYFTGKFLGKHKLIPKVSPKKTVEGAVGGVVSTVVFTCLYLALLKHVFKIDNIGGADYLGVGILAFIASIISQLGDLAASVIKRDCNVKDFGTILPGHGGIMDRFDSVIFIAPVVFYYLTYLP